MENIKFTTQIKSVDFTSEIKNVETFYMESEGMVNLLDELLVARDDLFENKLKEGIKQHKKLMSAISSDLPHQS